MVHDVAEQHSILKYDAEQSIESHTPSHCLCRLMIWGSLCHIIEFLGPWPSSPRLLSTQYPRCCRLALWALEDQTSGFGRTKIQCSKSDRQDPLPPHLSTWAVLSYLQHAIVIVSTWWCTSSRYNIWIVFGVNYLRMVTAQGSAAFKWRDVMCLSTPHPSQNHPSLALAALWNAQIYFSAETRYLKMRLSGRRLQLLGRSGVYSTPIYGRGRIDLECARQRR